MSQVANQDWVLARFREDTAKNDPPLYTVRDHRGTLQIWLSVNLNVGWYHPGMNGHRLVGLYPEAYPLPEMVEDGEGRDSLNWCYKYVGGPQRRKIEAAVAAHVAGS